MKCLNTREENIIKKFLECEGNYVDNILLLKWYNVGYVIAKYEIMLEDENDMELDDNGYEEFWSFGFKAIEIAGEPPIVINRQNNFLINYHNFPDEIIADDKKVN